jgi:hypothetical protein
MNEKKLTYIKPSLKTLYSKLHSDCSTGSNAAGVAPNDTDSYCQNGNNTQACVNGTTVTKAGGLACTPGNSPAGIFGLLHCAHGTNAGSAWVTTGSCNIGGDKQ